MVDWSLARQTPDYAALYQQGVERGQAQRQQRVMQEAMGLFGSDPERAIAMMMQVDPGSAMKLGEYRQQQQDRDTQRRVATSAASGDMTGARRDAIGSGNPDLLKYVNTLDEQSREALKRKTDAALPAYYQARQITDPAKRAAYFQSLAPRLAQAGWTLEELAAQDLSDAKLDGEVSVGLGLQDVMKLQADRQKFEADERHRREQEAIARQNAGTSAYSAQTGRLNYQARKKAGGFGTPGVGSIRDEDVEIDP